MGFRKELQTLPTVVRQLSGVQELLLCGETPGPPDARVLKTSLKAAESQKFNEVSRIFMDFPGFLFAVNQVKHLEFV